MSDAGRWCLPDPARKAHWIAMTSNSYGDGSTRGFDKLPPDVYQPDPALAGYPPPQARTANRTDGLRPAGTGTAVRAGRARTGSPAYPPPMPVDSALPDGPTALPADASRAAVSLVEAAALPVARPAAASAHDGPRDRAGAHRRAGQRSARPRRVHGEDNNRHRQSWARSASST